MLRCLRSCILVLAGTLVWTTAGAADEADVPVNVGKREANEILQTAGVSAGLCVHLGCRMPCLTAALAENSNMAVHGIALDNRSLDAARYFINVRNMSGRALVEKVPLNPLPYAQDLATLVVVEDLAALTAQGLTKDEILRVVSPNGVLCVKEGGKWTKTVKPRPKEMDDWGHIFHGADYNMVSNDKLVKFPLGFRWVDGIPLNVVMWAACRGWVIAGGRCYTLSLNELENLAPSRPKRHYLGARDAFNGVPLWKVDLGPTDDDGIHLTWRNAGPLVANEKRVYAVQEGKPIIVEGATGRIIAKCDTKYKANRLAVLDNVYLAACWEARHSTNDNVEGGSLWATWLPKSGVGTLEAFEADTGKPKWSAPLTVYALAASDGIVYALTHAGNPKSDQDLEKDFAQEVEKELTKELAAEAAKEPAKDAAKELDPNKEPPKEAAKEPPKELEPAKEAPKEAVKEPPKQPEPAKEAPKEAVKEPPKTLLQELASDMAKKLAKDFGKDSGKDVAKEQPWKKAWKKLSEDQQFRLRNATRNSWERQVVALDIQTGIEKWRVPHSKLGKKADLELGCAGPGYVVVYKRDERGVFALSAADGSILWQIKGGGTWTPVVDGLLWQGRKRFDPKTGVVKDQWPVDPDNQGCTPSNVVGNIVTRTRGCGYEEIVFEEGKPPKTRGLQYTGARGGCMMGMVPANGMFYTAQNWCRCSPGQIYGFIAVGPSGEWPTAVDFEKARSVEKGPAFGKIEEAATSADDWATFRHDAERSGGTAGRLPETLKELWKTQAAQLGEGPIAAAWQARLASCVSAPVVAGGMAFVAATDVGQIVALDAASGKKAWSATLGGRVDTPPTVHKGLALVGSHDGWVNALRAKDGQLAWRSRVAPWERKLVAYGEVESVWPTVGTVLVHDNVAYANAGRTCESDGGIAVVAFDPLTGNQLWGKAIGKGPQRQNDLLILRDGAVGWHHVRLDPKTGAATDAPIPRDHSQGGIMDGSWTMVGNRRSGNSFAVGKPADNKKKDQTAADLMAWNESVLVSNKFAMSRRRADATVGNVKQSDFSWKPAPPPDVQIEAIAVAANAVVFAGRTKDTATNKYAGLLWMVSAADGKTLVEIPLEAPPTYDGLAVAGEKVYVSLQNGTVLCFGKQ
ncbi:MAG: PQQ-binding-like beta-propeller repeat protein [Planctomycetota bacterium]|nr:PQQ-binding-like beta-propeller repeat protein [Planctomycetota bacterium]